MPDIVHDCICLVLTASFQSDFRGVVIAEGDILVLSIRASCKRMPASTPRLTRRLFLGLASELLLDRYVLPLPMRPDGVLAKHEAAIFGECRDVAKTHGHRSGAFASRVLPRCMSLIESIAMRMAHEAALSEGVPAPLVDLYVYQAVKEDLAWYVEAGLLTRAGLAEQECAAFDIAYPLMENFIDRMRVDSYVRAPIVSDLKWERFVQTLPVFSPADVFEYRPNSDAGRTQKSALPRTDDASVTCSSHTVFQPC